VTKRSALLDWPCVERPNSPPNCSGGFCFYCGGCIGGPPAITNGLAEFQALGVTFAGYVTPQGHLKMDSGYGPTVNADFNARQPSVLHGQAISVNCRSNVT
jgi:hypothetical protein